MAAKYTDVITTNSGTALPGATVQLLDGSGSLVTTYTDAALTQNAATSRTADDDGLVELYVADGTYTVRQAYGSVTRDLANVELYDISTIASTSSGAVANKAQASAIGISGAAENMGSYTGSTIPDNETAKQNIQSLETAVETKANAAAVGVTSSAANMGTYTGTTIPDNETAKQNIQSLETAHETLDAAHDDLNDRFRRWTHVPFAPDFTTNSITVRDGSSDTYHRHFGQIAEGMDGRLHLIYRRAAAHAVTDGATIYYTYSDDGGQTWSAEGVLVAGVAGFDQRGMSICVTPTGRVLVIYDKTPAPAVGTGTTTFRLVYSDDNGATWTQGADITSVAFDFARAYGRIRLIGSHVSNNYQLCWTPYYQTSAAPTYKVAAWYSSDDGLTWTEGTALDTTGYNEAEMVAINDQTWFAVARGTGLNFLKSTDGGSTWTDLGKITTSDGVAPSLDKFYHNGRWYLLVGYCDRDLDTISFKIAPVTDALTTPAAFGAPLTVATDAVNASGYQSTVTKPDGTVYMDEGVGFVWFKEYIGFDYTQVRFGRANLFELAQESGRGVAVASGAFTVYDTEFEPRLLIGTEGSAATDDLDTINGGSEGQIIRCQSITSGNDVTIKNGTGNIILRGEDFRLNTAGSSGSHIILRKAGDYWLELGRTNDGDNGFYETGTWTPVPQGSSTAGSPTGTFAGTYVKIGRQVFITCQLVFTGLSTMAGNVEVIGLPYTISAGAGSRAGISVGFRNNFTNDFVVGGYCLENSSTIRLMRMDQDNVALAVGDLSATSNIYFSATYRAST